MNTPFESGTNWPLESKYVGKDKSLQDTEPGSLK